MSDDQIRYDILVQEALRSMVRGVLADTAKKGLPGDHHFFITFDTTAAGVRLSERLRAQYPEDMTIVLQHQFRDLKVTETGFEVGLSFGGVPERLAVPFDAIKAFTDPSVQFTLQFETLPEFGEDEDEAPAEQPSKTTRPGAAPARTEPAPPAPAAGAAAPPSTEDKPHEQGGAEVVRLDRFRKK